MKFCTPTVPNALAVLMGQALGAYRRAFAAPRKFILESSHLQPYTALTPNKVSTNFENFLCTTISCTSLSHSTAVSRIIAQLAIQQLLFHQLKVGDNGRFDVHANMVFINAFPFRFLCKFFFKGADQFRGMLAEQSIEGVF